MCRTQHCSRCKQWQWWDLRKELIFYCLWNRDKTPRTITFLNRNHRARIGEQRQRPHAKYVRSLSRVLFHFKSSGSYDSRSSLPFSNTLLLINHSSAFWLLLLCSKEVEREVRRLLDSSLFSSKGILQVLYLKENISHREQEKTKT